VIASCRRTASAARKTETISIDQDDVAMKALRYEPGTASVDKPQLGQGSGDARPGVSRSAFEGTPPPRSLTPGPVGACEAAE
jgi:hypothetical protein